MRSWLRQALAYFDGLTSLPNQHLFKQQAAAALSDARATGCRVGILFIDLDRFEYVNDTLGHGAEDELPCIVAERLTASLRGRRAMIAAPAAAVAR